MACACKQRAAQAALLLQQQNAARLAAQSAEISAQETPLFDYSEFTAEEWAQAGGVIVASALLCGMLGQSFGHPVVGVVVGVALGAAINWQTGCHVCHAHAAAMMGGAS